MRTASIRDVLMPWAGLALGTVGAGIAHQLGADSTFQDCRVGSPWMVVVAVIVGLLVIAAGAAGSWRVYRADGEPPARRTIALVSLMADGLFTLAVVLPLIASLIIPPCWA
jgi:hypothetical protein